MLSPFSFLGEWAPFRPNHVIDLVWATRAFNNLAGSVVVVADNFHVVVAKPVRWIGIGLDQTQ